MVGTCSDVLRLGFGIFFIAQKNACCGICTIIQPLPLVLFCFFCVTDQKNRKKQNKTKANNDANKKRNTNKPHICKIQRANNKQQQTTNLAGCNLLNNKMLSNEFGLIIVSNGEFKLTKKLSSLLILIILVFGMAE